MVNDSNNTPDVSKFILNCLPSLNPELDWGLEIALAIGIHLPSAPIPPAKDLREPACLILNYLKG